MQESILKFNYLKKICNDINKISLELSNEEISFYREISVHVKFSDPELCFHTLISWSYILYHEYSAKNIEFIKKKILANNITITEQSIKSKQLIHAFRTIYQHQMDFDNKQSDNDKINLCNAWFEEILNKSAPNNSEDWIICVNQLLDYLTELILSIYSFLLSLKENEHLDIIMDEWKKIISRNYSDYEYEKVLHLVLDNLGLNGYFDTRLLVKKHSSAWSKDILILPDGFDFTKHAYKIIERFLLNKEIIPIDGNDIKSIGVQNGKEIFNLLERAKEIFYNEPCNKPELLNRLREYIK